MMVAKLEGYDLVGGWRRDRNDFSSAPAVADRLDHQTTNVRVHDKLHAQGVPRRHRARAAPVRRMPVHQPSPVTWARASSK
jgi:hypothetical protein